MGQLIVDDTYERFPELRSNFAEINAGISPATLPCMHRHYRRPKARRTTRAITG